jgi:hypothetical protein
MFLTRSGGVGFNPRTERNKRARPCHLSTAPPTIRFRPFMSNTCMGRGSWPSRTQTSSPSFIATYSKPAGFWPITGPNRILLWPVFLKIYLRCWWKRRFHFTDFRQGAWKKLNGRRGLRKELPYVKGQIGEDEAFDNGKGDCCSATPCVTSPWPGPNPLWNGR